MFFSQQIVREKVMLANDLYAYIAQWTHVNQDRTLVAALKNISQFSLLPEEAKRKILTILIEGFADYVKSSKLSNFFNGSTLNLTLQLNDCVINANVGDSSAFLIEIDEAQNVQIRRLNNRRHKASDPEEQKRIIAAGGCISSTGRVALKYGQSLALSRDICSEEVKGLIATPDITIVATPARKAYILGCSDGLTDVLSEAKLKEFLEQELRALGSLDDVNIANHLVQKAKSLETDHHDDITVIFAPIIKTPVEQSNARLFVVADGHGDRGSQVVEFIKDKFLDYVVGAINNQLNLPAKEAISIMGTSDENSSNCEEGEKTEPLVDENGSGAEPIVTDTKIEVKPSGFI